MFIPPTIVRHAAIAGLLAALAVIVALALGEQGVLSAVEPVPAAPGTAGAATTRVTAWYVQQVIQGTGIPTNPNLLLPASDTTVTGTRLAGDR